MHPNTFAQLARKVLRKVGVELLWVYRLRTPLLPKPPQKMVKQAETFFSTTFPLADDLDMSDEEIEERLAAFHWFYPFSFGTHEVGPNHHQYTREERKQAFYGRYLHIFSSLLAKTGGSLKEKRVLDIACNAGYYAIQARLAGAEKVVGVDASEKNIDQANLITRLANLDQLDYHVLNVYDVSKERLGTFDITFFFGILYHLNNPVAALERLYEVTESIAIIDTHLERFSLPILRIEHENVDYYHSDSYSNELAFMPSEEAVVMMLKSVGFREVFLVPATLPDIPDAYRKAAWGTFFAIK